MTVITLAMELSGQRGSYFPVPPRFDVFQRSIIIKIDEI